MMLFIDVQYIHKKLYYKFSVVVVLLLLIDYIDKDIREYSER